MTYILLLSVYMLVGVYAIAAQIYFIRELLVIFFGNELCLGIIFASWFAGIALGAGIAARISRNLLHKWSVFFLVIMLLGLLPFMVIPFMRMLRDVLGVSSGEYLSMLQMFGGTFIAVWPFSFMIGLFFPFACQVTLNHKDGGAVQIGLVYVWESIGSLIGGLMLSFILIPKYAPLQVFGCVYLLLLMVSLAIMLKIDQKKSLRVLKALFLILSGCIIFVFIRGYLPEIERYLTIKRWQTFSNHLNLVRTVDSRYENIVLAEGGGQYSIFGNGQFFGSYPDEYQIAIKAHLFMSQHPDPQRVLLIGEGATGLIREILKYRVKAVDYVELDPQFIEIITPVLTAQDRKALADRRVTIFYMDGRRYVKQCSKTYDLVIITAPDPSTAVLNRFYTVDFFTEVKKILSTKGIMTIAITGSVNYVGEEVGHYSGSLYRGLRKVFPFVMVIPGDKNYFFAGLKPDIFSRDYKVLYRRYEERNVSSEVFSPELFQWLLPRERIAFLEHALKEKSDVHLNTDFYPITYFYNLILWEIFTKGKTRFTIFERIQGKGIWWILVPLGVFLAIRCLVIRLRKGEGVTFFNCLWAIGTTGCAGIALEIMLIFSFQNMYGYIYQAIGIVVALFMMGLTLGGSWMRSWIKKGIRSGVKTLIILEVIIGIFAVALPFVIQGFIWGVQQEKMLFPLTSYLYMTLVFGAGLLTGLEFPLVSNILISFGYKSGYVAGWVDSTDHLGACIGSLVTATILMPLMGMYTTCFLVGMLNFSSFLFLLLTARIKAH